jgi:hypothetical protein
MNASEQRAARREKVLHGLFWGGMGLAPIAVLVLLFGQSTGSLRVAVTLSVLTIVMIAVSVAMRPSVEMLRVDIEHRVLDELERVRVRSREDITTAARNTHRALTEKIQSVADRFEDVRAQLSELHAQIEDVRANGAIAQAGEISGYAGGPPRGGPPDRDGARHPPDDHGRRRGRCPGRHGLRVEGGCRRRVAGAA